MKRGNHEFWMRDGSTADNLCKNNKTLHLHCTVYKMNPSEKYISVIFKKSYF